MAIFTLVFNWLSRFVVRQRLPLLVLLGVLTVFFGYQATRIQLSYDFAKVLPESDRDYQAYQEFKKTFGEDGSVLVIGLRDSTFFEVAKFNAWRKLGDEISKIDGIEAVISNASLYTVQRNDSLRSFDVLPVVKGEVRSQAEMDSLRQVLSALPFYEGFIQNSATGATLMAVTFDKAKLNTKSRIAVVKDIKEKALAFGERYGVSMHLSGMPYIRTEITSKVVREMQLFMGLAILVTAVVLFIFFRSFQAVFFSLVVVCVSVVWSVGTIALFGYKITVLSGLIPPLIIVIGIPNTIFFLNKYQTEFSRHGQQATALVRMIRRIGPTTFLANVTTAIGFGVLYFTGSRLLMEFGLVAAVNVMSTWMISLVLVPAIFSYLSPPDPKHTRHLQAPRITAVLERAERWIHKHTRLIYAVVIVLVGISMYGITLLSTVGYVVDDLPEDDPVYRDMKFFETEFKGVLPLELFIDAKEPGAAMKLVTLQKINRLQKMLSKYPEFARSLSVVDGVKFSYQAYQGGEPRFYILPGALQLAELSAYTGDVKGQMFRSFLDSTRQRTRVSVQMADVGSERMAALIAELRPRIDSIFPPDRFETQVTGNSLIFLKGNDYLFSNLVESIVLAIILISLIMVMLFMSVRMILISILPSIVPLIITAGLMGFFNIPLKPSTILIFSIAFGIASDQTIYFLTKYRHEMRVNPVLSISKAVTLTIRETGVSMIYTAVILYFGFLIFAASGFGGTASLGKLLSITLLLAMVANLTLLPAFLISLERRLTTKAFLSEPIFETDDEEEDSESDDSALDPLGGQTSASSSTFDNTTSKS